MMRWIYWLGWMSFGCAYRAIFSLRIEGRENLITGGAVLVASNHQSFLDPPLIGNLYQNEIYFLARKTLFVGFGKWLYKQWNAIPVDQDRPDMASLKTMVKLLQQGERVLVFPEGERSESDKMGTAQPGIGLIVAKSKAPVQPIRISGAREALPRGSGKIRFSRITVTIGKPIYFDHQESGKDKDAYQKIANRIMQEIEDLG
jgi:1-acyl-sn-glycerol-3-phosphate acyltransferase